MLIWKQATDLHDVVVQGYRVEVIDVVLKCRCHGVQADHANTIKIIVERKPIRANTDFLSDASCHGPV